jgi:hypothetical protein
MKKLMDNCEELFETFCVKCSAGFTSDKPCDFLKKLAIGNKELNSMMERYPNNLYIEWDGECRRNKSFNEMFE